MCFFQSPIKLSKNIQEKITLKTKIHRQTYYQNMKACQSLRKHLDKDRDMPHPRTASRFKTVFMPSLKVAILLLLHVQSSTLWEACGTLCEQLLRSVLLGPHLTPYSSVAESHTLKNISTFFRVSEGIHAENKQNNTITRLLARGEEEFGLTLVRSAQQQWKIKGKKTLVLS